MKRRNRSFKKNDRTENFWPAFTDMISTIALILFFLMLISYMQNIIAGQQIVEGQRKLEESNAQINKTEKKLRLLKSEVELIQAEVDRGERELRLSEEKIEDQKKIIAESNKELEDLRVKLRDIAVLRVEVLKKVKESIEEELRSSGNDGENLVTIGENGNIVINEGLVFDYDSYEIKKEGKDLLGNLSNAFENVLKDDETRKYIDAISIQGHTDDSGSQAYNRELSSKRASTVVNYLFTINSDLQQEYGKYFVASGYSEFRQISSNASRNRRIEIAIILKDSSVRKIIDDYLEESNEFVFSR